MKRYLFFKPNFYLNQHMKKLNLIQLFVCVLLALRHTGTAQNFTWVKGTKLSDQLSIYGSKGVPAPLNAPGSRDGMVGWKDAAGDFWMFGGYGLDAQGNFDYLNDLWKYTLSTHEWTWIGGDSLAYIPGAYGTLGIPSATAWPGSRTGSVKWTDASGNLWLFGGLGVDGSANTGELNDLWKFAPSTGMWTWMSGSSTAMQPAAYGSQGVPSATTTPGGAYSGVGWTDASGNLWLFGGEGYDTNGYGLLNDLWKYSTSNNQWTWVKGSGLADQNGVHGTLATPATANVPGGRSAPANWADASGNLWLMGGYGYDGSSTSSDVLNDQWKYSIATNQWTWMKGSNIASQGGTYGTQGVSAPANVPGSRLGAFSWTDVSSGNFYMFGGIGNFNLSSSDDMNDLWKYTPASNEWTWLKGNNSAAELGVYGIQGVPAAINRPGSRSFGASWTDNANNLWLFGGVGNSSSIFDYGDLNDLWKLTDCVAPNLSISSSHTTLCTGQTATLTATGAVTYSWSTSQTGASFTVSPVMTTTYYVLGTDASNCSIAVSYTLPVLPGPTVSASSAKSEICKGEKVLLTATGASSYSWNTTPASINNTLAVTPTVTTTYIVTGIEPNGCKNSFAITQTVNACTGVSRENRPETPLKLYPNPNNGVFTLQAGAYSKDTRLMIFNALGQKVNEQTITTEYTTIQTDLQKGVYFYQLIQGSEKAGSGRLVIE